MAKPIDHAAREARLAAKLRENLHRRKAQSRAQDAPSPHAASADPAENALENDSAALSKPSPES